MVEQNPFKWRHFQAEVILLCPLVSARASCHAFHLGLSRFRGSSALCVLSNFNDWNWEDRLAEIAELQHEQGGATNVKITLIGRPGQVSNKGTFVLTTMQSSKIPSLPKGLPIPA